MFDMAVNEIRTEEQSELVPYWCLGEEQSVKIERIIPMYPVSKDEVNYQRLIKVLSLYRLTMGQTRQEELVNYLLENETADKSFINRLFINLSPYIRTNDVWRSKMKYREYVVFEKKRTVRQRRIDELQEKAIRLEKHLEELNCERTKIKKYEVIGMIVYHKKWGEGIITKLDDSYLTVDFDGMEKQMVMPDAFVDGFLYSEHQDFVENEKKRIVIDERIQFDKDKIDEIYKELDELII